jgi:Zn-dependent M28 family amino/carboxypeptidase
MRISKIYLAVFAISVLFINTASAQAIKLSPTVARAMDVVKPDDIKDDITYLADDKLKGRMPGTEGYQMAVDYVVDHLKALKVKPAGENGTWLQTVRLRRAFVGDAALSVKYDDLNVAAARNANDCVVYPNPVTPNIKLSAPLVFAGYGISEPALGYDDFAGIDVKGKVIVITRGSPESFSSSVAAHVSNTSTILKTAAAHGAVGVIIASADSTLQFLPNFSKGVYSVMDDKGGVVVSRSYYSDQIKVFGAAKYTFLSFLFHNVGKGVQAAAVQMRAGKPQSFDVKAAFNASYTSTYQDIVSYNVVGKIIGSDPKLKNQYVVHSAHLDHLGIGTPVEGDSIYNGAHDNASGVASLLGIAKIYSHIAVKPKRSILIVMVTGEEMGDLGSGYFAKHPTVPQGSMVADVNTDMPTIIAPLLSITALGAEHSSLAKQVEQAATYLDISVEPDPEPKQARFTRSDQYSFVLVGVPALHVKYGSKTADGKNNLNDIVAPWRAKYYHKPQDDINGIFDFDAGKKYAQLNFLIGYLVAQDRGKPTWNVGDIFGPPAP